MFLLVLILKDVGSIYQKITKKSYRESYMEVELFIPL